MHTSLQVLTLVSEKCLEGVKSYGAYAAAGPTEKLGPACASTAHKLDIKKRATRDWSVVAKKR